MKNITIKSFILLLTLVSSLFIAGCSQPSDNPPSAASPEPKSLSGTYTSEEFGSMAFNGDGQTLEIQLYGNLAEEFDLNEEIHSGTYVFKFSNGAYRYDYADRLEIDIDGRSIILSNNHEGISDIRPTSFDLISVSPSIEGVDNPLYFERVSDKTGLTEE